MSVLPFCMHGLLPNVHHLFSDTPFDQTLLPSLTSGDPQSPHAHLHAHALFGPIDTSLPGATLWRRSVVFGGMNWWSLEDLRAEIR